jgi:WD40 repeat protein
MIGRTLSPAWARTTLGGAARVGALSCGVFVVLVLLALGEVFALRLAGFKYQPKDSWRYVSFGEFVVSADGAWGASQIGVSRASVHEGIERDVFLHNLTRRRTSRLFLGDLDPCCVAISPADKTLAIACTDGSIYAWNGALQGAADDTPVAGQLRWLYRSPDTIIDQIVFSPDGQLLAVGGARFLCLLQLPEGVLWRQWGHAGDPYAQLAFADDSRRLLSSDAEKNVRLWDALSGQQLRLVAPEDGVLETAFSPNVDLAAFLLADNNVCVWSLAKGEALWRRPFSTRSYGHPLAFSRDGRLLAVVGWDEGNFGIHLYDATGGRPYGRFLGHDIPIGLDFSSARQLYSWDAQGTIRAWDVEHRREQSRFSTYQWLTNQ